MDREDPNPCYGSRQQPLCDALHTRGEGGKLVHYTKYRPEYTRVYVDEGGLRAYNWVYYAIGLLGCK